jgi:hypothetical protein
MGSLRACLVLIVAGAASVACGGSNARAVMAGQTACSGTKSSDDLVSNETEPGTGDVPDVTGPDGLRASYSFDETSGSYATEALSRAQAPIHLATRVAGLPAMRSGLAPPRLAPSYSLSARSPRARFRSSSGSVPIHSRRTRPRI